MRKILLLAVAVAGLAAPLLAQSARVAPEPAEVVKLEQNLWTTLAEGSFASVRGLFTTDFIEVDDHILAVDQLLVTLKHCKLETYELSDLQVRILTPDSAVTAYHVVDTFNCGTEEKPDTKTYDKNSMTVWVRQPNSAKWLVQAHTETPVKP
jgi:Domain of unknown function (DUF4440)